MRLGHDLCLIERFDSLLTKEVLLRRIFGRQELEQAKSQGLLTSQFLAGSWAAKESLSKALGLGIFNWQLHEAQFIRLKPKGAREWLFSGEMTGLIQDVQIRTSVSYEAGIASAITIIF